MSPKQNGFTLLEMVIVIALSAIVIIYLAQLQKMTGRVSIALKTVENDWNAQQFIRKQIWHIKSLPFNEQLKFTGEADQFQFITRYSAQHGNHGPYILANYQYHSGKQRLQYQEAELSNYWHPQHSINQQQTLELTALQQIKKLQIYYQDSLQNWIQQWHEDTPPTLIKISYNKGGQAQSLILETQVLSYSMHSGYLPASP